MFFQLTKKIYIAAALKHQTHILVLHNEWQVNWTNVTDREHRSAKLGFVCPHQVSWRYEMESKKPQWQMNGLNFGSFTKLWLMAILCHCCKRFSPDQPTHWMCFIFHFCSTSTLITRFGVLRYAVTLSLSLLYYPRSLRNWRRSRYFFLDFAFFSTIIRFHIRTAIVMRNVAKWNGSVCEWNSACEAGFMKHCLSIHRKIAKEQRNQTCR